VNRALEQTGYLQTFGKLWKLSFVFIARAYDRVKSKRQKSAVSVLPGMQTGPKAGCRIGKPA
jgi:hypothetical protein